MTRESWTAQIRNAREPAEQILVLKALKNELIGHPLKKASAVASGVLDPIVRLSLNRSGSGNNGKSHDHTFAARPLTEEETVRLQGLHIIASIALGQERLAISALGGPSFLAALQSASALPAILSNLCPLNNPSQLVLASIRALSNLTETCFLAPDNSTLTISALADALFTRQHISSLSRIISQTSSSVHVQNQISSVASLISRVCQKSREECHQQNLANSGVLDALAAKLASFVVADGLVIPGADVAAKRDGLEDYFPSPAPSHGRLALILEAIAVIISDSKYRASQLLYSPYILAIFPMVPTADFMANQHTRANWTIFNGATLSSQQGQLNAMDFLLPCIPVHQSKSAAAQASAFPPLGSSGSRENLVQNMRLPLYNRNFASDWANPDKNSESHEIPVVESEDPESPLIAYLIHIIRSRLGIERLMAAFVLSVLFRAGLTSKSRETAIGLLVVPVLVKILEEVVIPIHKDPSAKLSAIYFDRAVKERASTILATLITDSEYLQKSAFEAGAVSKLSKLLKMAYDPLPDGSQPDTWSPHDSDIGEEMDTSQYISSQSLSPLLAHHIEIREGTLKAIAALVPFKDEYRKAMVEQGVVPYIVESLAPNPGKPSSKIGEKSEKSDNEVVDVEETRHGYGVNPVNVLIAACGAIRALSRSVSILRTSLIDHGVAIPVFKLLKHPDIDVQIAATATVINLVTDISPMRVAITNAGVLKILCEHARSGNAKLRLNAVWALKHFVHSVSNDMKRTCLEELGQGWLVQLICDDTEDDALGSAKAGGPKASTSFTEGEADEDVEMDQFEEQTEPAQGSSTSRPGSSRSKSIQQAEARLAILREAETNPAKKARKDDIAVQEQGLDFIRNLIGGAGQGGTSETSEMIDFLFTALGQERVFEILASKLRPKVVNPFNRRTNPAAETRVVPPQAEIIKSVGYILVHMAASVPRHRQIVIAQTELLKLLVPYFNHPNTEVRLPLCWLVTNLTWVDDSNDAQACAQRANELKRLGFLSKLEQLETDPELNVRERAKSALYQMKQAY